MILEYGNLAAIHGGRVTIMPKDIQLVMKIKEVTATYKVMSRLQVQQLGREEQQNKMMVIRERRFSWSCGFNGEK